jgi:O-antigen/teichoic acid export membrane protein
MLYTILDRFFLVWKGNKLALTYYSISQNILIAFTTVTVSMILVTIPRLSYYWASNQKKEYYRLFDTSSKTFLLINIPCCIGMACLANEIIYIYSGEKYIAASSVMFLFSIRYLIETFDIIFAKQILLVTGNEKILMHIYYIGGICNLIFKIVLVLINKLTPELCVITTACADILVIIWEFVEIKKLNIEIKIIDRSVIRYIMSSCLFFLVIWGIKYLITETSIKEIATVSVLSILSCTILYIILLFIQRDKYFHYFLGHIKFINKY